jgi:hypothetical protein
MEKLMYNIQVIDPTKDESRNYRGYSLKTPFWPRGQIMSEKKADKDAAVMESIVPKKKKLKLVLKKKEEASESKEESKEEKLKGRVRQMAREIEKKVKEIKSEKQINLKPVDDMKTKDVLIEANVLSGREDIAKRVIAGESRNTPREMGTSIDDIRSSLKELRRSVYGKDSGLVDKKSQYKMREGSLM